MVQEIIISQQNNVFIAEYKNSFNSIDEVLYLSIEAIQKYGSIENAIKKNHKIINFISISNLKEYEPLILVKIDEILGDNNKKDYIYFKIKILNRNLIKYIAPILSFFFTKTVFYPLIIFVAGINLLFYLKNNIPVSNMDNMGIILYSIIILITLLFHELGHSISAYLFTKRLKYIGFGFYNKILPVFFADVSHTWHLKKDERIIVTLSGIYMQLLINSVLIFFIKIKLLEQSNIINQFFLMNGLIIIYTLIPFLRNDGYWVLSDLFSINNLNTKSIAYLSKAIVKKEKINFIILIYSFFYLLFNMLIIYGISLFMINIYNTYSKNPLLIFNINSIGKSIFDLIFVFISIMIIRSKFIMYKNVYKNLKNG